MGPGRWLISLVNRQIVKSTANCGLAAKGRQLERAGGRWVGGGVRGDVADQVGNVKEVPQASARVTFEPIFTLPSGKVTSLVGIKLELRRGPSSGPNFDLDVRSLLQCQLCSAGIQFPYILGFFDRSLLPLTL